jgi:hypothetical protein
MAGGRDTFGRACAWVSRSDTTWRARKMSVPGSKIITMDESPATDCEWILSRNATPWSRSASSGTVISCSTSFADSPSASVWISTYAGANSGRPRGHAPSWPAPNRITRQRPENEHAVAQHPVSGRPGHGRIPVVAGHAPRRRARLPKPRSPVRRDMIPGSSALDTAPPFCSCEPNSTDQIVWSAAHCIPLWSVGQWVDRYHVVRLVCDGERTRRLACWRNEGAIVAAGTAATATACAANRSSTSSRQPGQSSVLAAITDTQPPRAERQKARRGRPGWPRPSCWASGVGAGSPR